MMINSLLFYAVFRIGAVVELHLGIAPTLEKRIVWLCVCVLVGEENRLFEKLRNES